MSFEISVHKNVLAISLDTRGDKVLVGDLMRSMSVLTMANRDPLKLDVLAVDSKPVWMTAVKFVNDYTYIGADDRNNIFALSLTEKDGNNANISKLQLRGGFHVGSLINCFRSGNKTKTTKKNMPIHYKRMTYDEMLTIVRHFG